MPSVEFACTVHCMHACDTLHQMPLLQMRGSPLQDALEYVDLEENFAIQQSKKRKGNVFSSSVVYKIWL